MWFLPWFAIVPCCIVLIAHDVELIEVQQQYLLTEGGRHLFEQCKGDHKRFLLCSSHFAFAKNVCNCAYWVVVDGNNICISKGTLPPRQTMSRGGGGHVAQEDASVEFQGSCRLLDDLYW